MWENLDGDKEDYYGQLKLDGNKLFLSQQNISDSEDAPDGNTAAKRVKNFEGAEPYFRKK